MDLLVQIGLSNAVVATVLAVTAALIGWASKRPALAHALWLLVLLKLITPPLYPVEVSWFASPVAAEVQAAELDTNVGDVATLPEADPDGEEPWPPAEEQGLPANDHQATSLPETAAVSAAPRPAGSPFSWRSVVPVIWIAGSFIWPMLATVRLYRFRRLLRYARPADHAFQQQVQRLAWRLSITQCPRAWFIPGRISPLLWAFGGTPSLILPHDLVDRLSAEQLEALLTHELAHLRRRDHWVRALEFVTTCLFWWHPVVWWARREIREAEEQCCDAWVVWAMPERVRGYALALVETVDFLSEARPALPPATTGIGYVRDLRRRMTMIMRGTTPRALTWSGGLVVLAVAAFMLPMLPTLAQGPPPGRPSPDDDLKRAEADLQQAAARLEQARAQAEQSRHREKSADDVRDGHSDLPHQLIRTSEACVRCHADAHEVANSKMGDELQNVHATVIRLAADIQKQRSQLHEMEMKLNEATRNLEARSRPRGEARDKQPEAERPRRRVNDGRGDDAIRRNVPPEPAELEKRAEQAQHQERDARDAEIRKHLVDVEKHNQDQINALMKQMERVMMELESLRKEMRDRPNTKPSKEVGKPGSDSRFHSGSSESNPDQPNPAKP